MAISEWWQKAVIYQIYPKSFNDSNGDGIGDLPGITAKLDYLKALGVDALWISPIYASPQVDSGYDISNYRVIDPRFGTNEDLYRLITEAHTRNIKVIMDLVANHTSDQHVWFQQSRQSRNNYFSDFYIGVIPVLTAVHPAIGARILVVQLGNTNQCVNNIIYTISPRNNPT